MRQLSHTHAHARTQWLEPLQSPHRRVCSKWSTCTIPSLGARTRTVTGTPCKTHLDLFGATAVTSSETCTKCFLKVARNNANRCELKSRKEAARNNPKHGIFEGALYSINRTRTKLREQQSESLRVYLSFRLLEPLNTPSKHSSCKKEAQNRCRTGLLTAHRHPSLCHGRGGLGGLKDIRVSNFPFPSPYPYPHLYLYLYL